MELGSIGLTQWDCVKDARVVVEICRGVLARRGPGPRDATPLFEYEPNTWRPPEGDRTLALEGGWHNPKPKEVCPDDATCPGRVSARRR
jgi:hypothetical protein